MWGVETVISNLPSDQIVYLTSSNGVTPPNLYLGVYTNLTAYILGVLLCIVFLMTFNPSRE